MTTRVTAFSYDFRGRRMRAITIIDTRSITIIDGFSFDRQLPVPLL